MQSKLIDLSAAIDRFVPSGSTVAACTCLEALIPFAAAHEIMRQKKRDLTLVGPISDICFDQLIGAGCVSRVRAAWVGNVITGSGYNFRQAVESGGLEVEDHSNYTISTALRAGASGIPFLPVRTALGSSLMETNHNLKTITCPFTGDTLAAVAAITPDVAIIHVQRADPYGNAHLWGNLGIAREACLASDHVILTAETIVDSEVITSDPNRVFTPGFRVSAVAHVPWGGHPSAVPGFYNRDHQMYLDYRNASRTPAQFAQWQQEWVDGPSNRFAYLEVLGQERMDRLTLKHHVLSEPADYGY
ncbi:MAG: CoA-transferase [Desulfovermiculus sp.]|nr:CoA-transferase [Desulfovermiculus sp.]